jgi:two-component system, NarL family, nitrate/nitrite response regulator NarL
MPIRILVIDDHTMVREGLRLLIDAHHWFRIIAEAGGKPEACELASREQPDVILLDLDLGGHSGLDILPELLRRAPRARVVVLTGVRDIAEHRRAIRLGAAGIVRKENAADVLARAIEKVHAGEIWIDRTLAAQALAELTSVSGSNSEMERSRSLTSREREVTSLIAEALSNKEIARRLGITETTVRHHLTSIFSKLAMNDRLELALFAVRHGLGGQSDDIQS